jgi:nucleoside-diphosphate-sugar epimerase
MDTNMAILVTGAGGFVGQNLIKRLVNAGKDVVATDINLAQTHAKVMALSGDLSDENFRRSLFENDIEAVIHLAAVPGGTAEQNPQLSFDVNVQASIDLMEKLGQSGAGKRFVYASTIAVLGETMPESGVTDQAPLQPKLYYGVHKQMCEAMLATLTRRGLIEGVGLRLPGIVARPPGPSGLKSAFMSDIFHALRQGEDYVLPVSSQARMWIMSLDKVTENLMFALNVSSDAMPDTRVVTLPAVHAKMDELVASISKVTGNSADGVSHQPDPALEKGFGSYPPLIAEAAERAGFHDDGNVEALVERVLAQDYTS